MIADSSRLLLVVFFLLLLAPTGLYIAGIVLDNQLNKLFSPHFTMFRSRNIILDMCGWLFTFVDVIKRGTVGVDCITILLDGKTIPSTLLNMKSLNNW